MRGPRALRKRKRNQWLTLPARTDADSWAVWPPSHGSTETLDGAFASKAVLSSPDYTGSACGQCHDAGYPGCPEILLV